MDRGARRDSGITSDKTESERKEEEAGSAGCPPARPPLRDSSRLHFERTRALSLDQSTDFRYKATILDPNFVKKVGTFFGLGTQLKRMK